MANKVIVLFSGGIDSTALINYYLELGSDVTALFIDYNQKSNKSEFSSAKQIAEYYQVPLKKIQLNFKLKIKNFEYSTRNLLLLNIATSTVEFDQYILSIGIHSGTPYYDCSKSFVEDTQKLFDGYFNGRIVIDAPFLDYRKKEIIEYFSKKKLPIEKTYSCEIQNKSPCGHCPSCLDRKEYLNEN